MIVVHGLSASTRRQRMMIAGRDVPAATMRNQAGQCEAAAKLQDFEPLQIVEAQDVGQHEARRPDHAEKRPGGGGDAQALGQAIGVAELLEVFEALDLVVAAAHGLGLHGSFVGGHGVLMDKDVG